MRGLADRNCSQQHTMDHGREMLGEGEEEEGKWRGGGGGGGGGCRYVCHTWPGYYLHVSRNNVVVTHSRVVHNYSIQYVSKDHVFAG